MSPDPYYGSYDVNNPQSMNRYSYVLNNPLAYVDPDGTSGPCDGDGSGCDTGCQYDDPCGGLPPSDPGPVVPGDACAYADACVVADPSTPDPDPCDFYCSSYGNTGNGPSGLPYIPSAGVPAGFPIAPNSPACQLVAPGGNYNVGPNAVALFQPQMADALTNAFNFLNSQGITPLINSGYRSPADQMRMRNGASGPNPAAIVSWHQAGMAVDINGTASSYFPTVISAMQAQGLTWGGTFSHRDPPHFQLPRAGTRPSAATVSACAAAVGGQG